MRSCIYEGMVTHRRSTPVTHEFQYRLFMVYLDLGDLPRLVGHGRLISSSKRAWRSFLRNDHLFERSGSLANEVRTIVRQRTGQAAKGPVRLLTQLRYFGYYFSPINLFFVFDDRDEQIEFVVAEVNNTPWKERHCYVLWEGNQTASRGDMRFAHNKDFHVSPFMDMAMAYHWQLTNPGQSLDVKLTSSKEGNQMFSASMKMIRYEIDRPTLRRVTARYPLMTAQISLAIYYQALKLWWKKCPFYTHPTKLPKLAEESSHDGLATTKADVVT